MTAKSKARPSPSGTGATAGRYGTGLSLALAAPLILLLGFAFLYPVGRLLSGSVFAPQATATHYARILGEGLYPTIFWRTFEIAGIVAFGAFLLGYPVAWAMSRLRGWLAALVAACVLVPLWTSVLVRSYAWIVLLQRTGVANSLLLKLGIIAEPLRLIYTEGAVIMAMTHVLLPYMILPIYASLRGIPPDLARAARNLGAGAIGAFVRVTLPLSLPGVYAGALMVFILALGFYITPALVGGPRTMLISTLIGQQTTELLDWPFAGALSGVLLAATLCLVFLFRRFLTLGNKVA
jgi:mannopine transport system permease protein